MERLILILIVLCAVELVYAQQLTRDQWGAPAISVSGQGGSWTVVGKKTKVTLNEADLSMTIDTGSEQWKLKPSTLGDLNVRARGRDIKLRLADARKKTGVKYDTGFKTGIKLTLSGWGPADGGPLDATLFLTVAIEGRGEDVVFDIAAAENGTSIRQLDWPAPLDARSVDYTVLSNGRGTLLPRNWPKEYYPIRTITPEGKIAATDHSIIQSHVVESWSMSWWGFERGGSAMMLIVETPDDAAYQFEHAAGGPTVIGPRWLASLGRLSYPRSVRMSFLSGGNYVDMAKRYRRYAMDSGLFVSLKEKIVRTPELAKAIGTPQIRASILRDIKPESDRYDKKDPSKNLSLTTFEERARQLRILKAKGYDDLIVTVTGWPHFGYDHQHPDAFPPTENGGGWAGLKLLYDTARELSYTFMMHDQYRDYYIDAPSFDPQFAIHEEDPISQAVAFAGSRFGDSKEGVIPFMNHWDGGKQSYLNARFQLGHLLKNNALLFDHGIRPQGIYIDVIGYVPPDQDFNPEHPTTRTDAMKGQIAMLDWARHNLGITSTEAGSDWVVPYVDLINNSGGGSKAILVPLYDLVFHDAVIRSYASRDLPTMLRGLLGGGVPEMPVLLDGVDEKTIALIRTMAALHRRVGLLEMTKHEFLGANFRKERTTFADGTTVTVDWDANNYTIKPELGS